MSTPPFDTRGITPLITRYEEARKAALASGTRHATAIAILTVVLAIVAWLYTPQQLWVLVPLGGAVGAIALFVRAHDRWTAEFSRETMNALCAQIGGITPTEGFFPTEPYAAIGVVGKHEEAQVTWACTGRHRHREFSFAHVRLERWERRQRKSSNRVFEGLLLRVDLGTRTPRLLLVRNIGPLGSLVSRKFLDFSGHMTQVSVGHAELESLFDVRTDDVTGVRLFLSQTFLAALRVLVGAEGRHGPVVVGLDGQALLVAVPRLQHPFRLGMLYRSLDQVGPEIDTAMADLTLARRVIDALSGS